MWRAPIGWHQHAPKDVSYFLEGWANWVAQTCPLGMFVIFLKVWVLDFPSSSQIVPIEFLLFPSISHQNPFVLIKFPNNSHQIPFAPINNPSKFFCFHQVSIKFLLFPSSFQKVLIAFLFAPINNPSTSFCFHQVPKQFPSNSSCSHQIPIKFLLFSSIWRIGRWTQRWMIIFVKDSSYVLIREL
jgi:hypothetical protein